MRQSPQPPFNYKQPPSIIIPSQGYRSPYLIPPGYCYAPLHPSSQEKNRGNVMPIPTRSLSVREPQKRQAVNGDSTLPLGSRSSGSRRLTTSSEILHYESSSGLGITYGNANGGGSSNGIPEKKSFLPQRRTIPRPQSLQIPQSTVQSARSRQSGESRLEGIKSTRTAPLPSESANSRPGSSRARSPTKPKPEPKRALAKPPNSAPPARQMRSSSLLHPAAPKLVNIASHARHQSQIINLDTAKSRPQSSGRPSSYYPGSKLAGAPSPTYQARFGLKKPSKSTTNSPETLFENPSPSPTPPEDQLSPEQTLALQTELLQLHVLHSQGLQTKAKWEAHAERHYRKLHESVKASYRREQERYKYQNLQAVKKFEEKSRSLSSGHDFTIQMGILSRVIQEVTHLTESEDSQYNTVVGVFEEWTQHVAKLKQSRELKDDGEVNRDKLLSNIDEDGEMQFIDPLPPQWKEDIAALSVQLSQLAGNLDDLDIPKTTETDKFGRPVDFSESALLKTVTGHKSLVSSMIEELDMIYSIEMEIMEFEILWMERALESVGANGTKKLHFADS
ncbi:conserved hypothetical protein [Trichophyton verrucosum HKI 0517]|uniref:Uncharacterized protein n=1 Tax=Trichophyton verrucosum (strain HKI 0517) TaxID=663202 RepID=D4D1B2_TRIVH|nr:uncharacterized protein TRV_00860 [Trichophyton verrucosum HKI 0517]EFE44330.1 conserved hypothetical protein [Trichophyton verrucosum HKI 0517]